MLLLFKKETKLLRESQKLNINEKNWIDAVAECDYGQGVFNENMFIRTSKKYHVRITTVVDIMCKNDNGIKLKGIVVKKLDVSIKTLLLSIQCNNQ